MKKKELKEVLELHGLQPNSRFGQNFLVDESLIKVIPEDAGVLKSDFVLEIGPGVGSLTLQLLDSAKQVCAIELDHGLARLLRIRFAPEIQEKRLILIEGDILSAGEKLHSKVEAWWKGLPQSPRIVSNLPYSISGPFLARLPSRSFSSALLLLQKEVAEKITRPGVEGWSSLAIRMALSFDCQLGRKVPPEVFWPRPLVNSSFLILHPACNQLSLQDDMRLNEVLRFVFAQRRKKMMPRLKKRFPRWYRVLKDQGVSLDVRPGSLEPKTWLNALSRVSL